MNIKELLAWGKSELKGADVLEPESSAEVLLAEVLNLSRTEIFAKSGDSLTKSELKKYQKFIKRRKNHEPVWQIIGKVDFWGMEYVVTKDVLVPRPETEILVQKVLDRAKIQNRTLKVLDLGTGSGTIVVALANALNNCSFYASDISGAALGVAKKNAKNLAKEANIQFKKGDLLNPWSGQKFDIICANLPYIPHEEMDGLAFDVIHHEPRVALDGGTKGIEIYERFVQELPEMLEPAGVAFCEIGIEQGKLLESLVGQHLPKAKVEVISDLSNIDRVVIITT